MAAADPRLAHWTAVARPRHQVLEGTRVRLEPLSADRHAEELHAAGHDGGDPALWDYLSCGPFASPAKLRTWIAGWDGSDDPLLYAVVDLATGRAGGQVGLLSIVPEHGRIEIGHVWFGATLQRTPQATEAIFLLARHAMDDLGYRRLEWKCNAQNARSRAAAQRFGFTFEGVFRQHMVSKGRSRDSAWFSLLDGEWPAARAAFERWLDPANFAPDGTQRRSLAALREPPA